MKVETIKNKVSELRIPGSKSENPLMIQTPGTPIGNTHGPTMPAKAGPALADTTEHKPPVAFPVGYKTM